MGPSGPWLFQILEYGGDVLSLELEFVACLFQMKCIVFRARRLSFVLDANLVRTFVHYILHLHRYAVALAVVQLLHSLQQPSAKAVDVVFVIHICSALSQTRPVLVNRLRPTLPG